MDLLQHLRALAYANHLANRRLHEAMRPLPTEAFHAPRTSFFPSLAKTLDHIVQVDVYYLAALRGEADMQAQWRAACAAPSPDLMALAARQSTIDRALIAWCDALDAPALDREVRMDRGGGRIQVDRAQYVLMHLFTHDIHHRGQVHAMLAGTSIAPPQLDEFLMPSEAYLREADLAAVGWNEAMLFGEAARS
jgi:uncharacterized damage-inducible protein DinB